MLCVRFFRYELCRKAVVLPPHASCSFAQPSHSVLRLDAAVVLKSRSGWLSPEKLSILEKDKGGGGGGADCLRAYMWGKKSSAAQCIYCKCVLDRPTAQNKVSILGLVQLPTPFRLTFRIWQITTKITRQILQILRVKAAAACFGCSCVFQPAIDSKQTRKSSCKLTLHTNLHANGRPNTVAIAKEEFIPRGDHANENRLSKIKIKPDKMGCDVIRKNHKRKKYNSECFE